jgi:single-stranded DNA-binding protein
MRTINQVILLGVVDSLGEVLESPSGHTSFGFIVRTVRCWKDKNSGETRTSVEKHEIILWGRKIIDAVAPLIQEGYNVFIRGFLRTSPSGVVEIVGEEVIIL